MDKYHIYEDIGKGEFSQVYKGREKKKVEFVAIKRVDKKIRNKIVNEVQIMHKLENPHIVRFYDWYETRNNLWLILEYCTGGNLENLLLQDQHLPETSVKIFAFDVMAGLKYLHSLGILHCDIRPKNLLIDEYGIVKFANFEFARKIPKQTIGSEPLSARGFPAYMAPELFEADGVHSFASDFWSVGCVMYILRRGVLPWGHSEYPEAIIEKLNDRLYSPLEGNKLPAVSSELADLISWLLEKAPCDRCNWKDFCNHPFWAPSFAMPPSSLPPHPVYEAYIMSIEKRRLLDIQNDIASEIGSVVAQEYDSSRPPLADSTPVRPKIKPSHRSKNNDESQDDDGVDPFSTPGILGKVKPSKKRDRGRTLNKDVELPNIELVAIATEYQLPDVKDLIIHASDLQVKPIIGNKAIEVIENLPFKAATIGHPVVSLKDVSVLSQTDLESHLTLAYKTIHKVASQIVNTTSMPTAYASMVNSLSYLHSLSTSPEVANIVLNTSFIYLLSKIMRTLPSNSVTPSRTGRLAGVGSTKTGAVASPASSSIASIKIMILTVLGSMIRYATFVQPPAESKREEHIIPLCLTILKDGIKPDVKLRRRAIAALGELLFYVTAQEEDSGTDSHRVGGTLDRWVLPDNVPEILLRCIRDDTDEVVKHYASKTVENVLAQGNSSFRLKLLTVEFSMALLDHSLNAPSESLQGTCGMALSHVFHLVMKTESSRRGSTNSASFFSQALRGSNISGIIDNLRDGHPRLQNAFLNIMNLLFVSSDADESSLRSFRLLFAQSSVMSSVLVRFIEQGSTATLRAKAMLAIQLICRFSPILLVSLSEKRFPMLFVRILEPHMASQSQSHLVDQPATQYLSKCAQSMIQFLQFTANSCLLKIAEELKQAAITRGSKAGATETPLVMKQRSPSTPSVRTNSSAKKDASTPSKETVTVEVDEALISEKAQIVTSIISLSSHGNVRKLVFSSNSSTLLIAVASVCIEFETLKTLGVRSSSLETLEECIFICLETIAKIDFRRRLEDASDTNNVEDRNAELLLLRIFTTRILPILFAWSRNHEPEKRVVVMSLLRSCLPDVLWTLDYVRTGSTDVNSILAQLFEILPDFLQDFSPIPEFSEKLIHEIEALSDNLAKLVNSHIDNAGEDVRSLLAAVSAREVEYK